MKRLSVKLKIAGWLTLLTAVMSILLLVFMLSISSSIASQTAMSQLSQTVQLNVSNVEMKDNKLQMGEGFTFYHNGVSTLIYNQNKALLAGQLPVSFKVDEPFENGLTRSVMSGDQEYLIMDLWLPMGWNDGLWVRGLMEVEQQQGLTRNLIYVAMIALPIFILLAALGSYYIVKRAFKPLESITATAKDINEAKDLTGRIALPPGRDEFSQLATTFDKMFERLEQSFNAEKQFTADASHELRTPLSVIRGACEYADKYNETMDEWQETSAMIYRQALSMSELISQLLSMTRLDQGTEMLHQETLELGALVNTTCQEQGYNMENIFVEFEEDVAVWGDSALISRLIINLIDNAIKYGRTNGRVWVSVKMEGNESLLSVRDDGIGIDAEQQEKVWQRFYQIDPSRGEECGAGLGLSMVNQIARAHGGYMTLESAINVGSCFTLHLPIKKIN